MMSFIAFVQKEFLHIFRDMRTLTVLFGMPLAQIILFGYAITTDVQNASIAVLDQSYDARSTELTRRFISSGYFKIAEEVRDQSQIEEAFKRGTIKMAIVFPPNFATDLGNGGTTLQVLADASDPNTASTLVAYVSALVGDYATGRQGDGATGRQGDGAKGGQGIGIETIMHYNPNQRSVNMFVPGVVTIILLLVSAMLTSIALTREKEMGNMEILLVSPLRPLVIILGKVVPYLVLSMVNVTFILLVGIGLFKVPLEGSILLLVGESLLFVVCALSLGVLISTVAKTQQVALLLSLMGLMMPTILLSNFIFPISSMPLPLQIISNIIPAKYFITIIKGIMLKGVGIKYLLVETGVLAGMTLFFIAVSRKRFKIRL